VSPRRMTFYFDAASCSGCKACQIACLDRNGLDIDRPWRRVSEVAGGCWEKDGQAWRNSVFAYHLSISCNHCERPICLEGCPARAITQRDDGVVLIDPDHCLGCGYCSWTCPYSAPRLHAAQGVMTKCTFCAEDLDQGREPACVAACPVRALDAGDPAELAVRHGSSDHAAGLAPLPCATLTEPALHLAPHADGERSTEPDVALTPRPPRGLREWSLVLFTVLSQMAAGLAIMASGVRSQSGVMLPVVAGLLVVAMVISTLHLGRPRKAWRSLLNLGSSWLSREIFLAGALLMAAVSGLPWLAMPMAVVFLVGMGKVYMQRTVPVWNSWRTPLAFLASAVVLGGLLANVLLWTVGDLGFGHNRVVSIVLMLVSLIGVGIPWAFAGFRRGGLHGFGGIAGVVSSVALMTLLVVWPESAHGPAPLILSWATLGFALADQFSLRREYFARYERLGV